MYARYRIYVFTPSLTWSLMKKYSLLICLLMSLFTVVNAQQVEKSTYGAFALTNASVETVTKGRLENATVIIRNGLIEAVGVNVPIPADAQVIDCKDLEIYPGMIDGGTKL